MFQTQTRLGIKKLCLPFQTQPHQMTNLTKDLTLSQGKIKIRRPNTPKNPSKECKKQSLNPALFHTQLQSLIKNFKKPVEPQNMEFVEQSVEAPFVEIALEID